ncbi:ribonuclease HI [Oligoflexaceae bacterium]|nr:ribonuclease HI [Oligoflexaceae bacterium]
MENVELITDGSCLGNPGPGGWAALLRKDGEEKLFTGGEPETTNNRMEMSAVIEGVKVIGATPCQLKIVSDSKYVIDAFEKNWIGGWLKRDWKNAAKKPVKNKDLWLVLIELLKPHTVQWQWVKGHSGHPDNEIVDSAAQKAAAEVSR